MRKLCVAVSLIVWIATFFAGNASAQDTTGTIAGRIVDAQGLAVPGVTVSVTGVQGVKVAHSDGEGRFKVPFLTPGSYDVRSELSGFMPVDRLHVEVRLGQTVEIPLTMQVGQLQESIKVVSTAPPVEATTATIGASLDSTTLSRLPVGRRF